jgi:hypothetical protein
MSTEHAYACTIHTASSAVMASEQASSYLEWRCSTASRSLRCVATVVLDGRWESPTSTLIYLYLDCRELGEFDNTRTIVIATHLESDPSVRKG